MSEQATRKPQYIRLALFTFAGVFVAQWIASQTCVRGGISITEAITPVIAGGLGGAALDYVLRFVRDAW
jgi:hypothetical protein